VPNVDKPDIGTDTPGKASSEYNIYLRDDAVRQAVLNRANGKCEYCGRHTFKVDSGKYYLETHHIIALSKEGKDRISNVIALCPEDHRRAHYATNRLEVEKKMIEIVSRTSK
jgi:5-methylcytosine-specific restriction protein A